MQTPDSIYRQKQRKLMIQCWVIVAGFGVIGLEVLGMYLLSAVA